MQATVARLLSSRWAPALIVAAALLLMAPALTVGFTTDDHVHRVLSRAHPEILGFRSRPLDLFVFTGGRAEENGPLMDEGVFPWWTAPNAKLAFMRPLSSLTHALDHALWPESARLAQAHSLVWFALSLVALYALYATLFDARWAAALALLVAAVDDARGPTVGWIANRNATIALALAVPALLLHIRARRRQSTSHTLASALVFGLALLAGESALATAGYLAAYALCLDRGSARARIASLAPHALVLLAWRAVYVWLGYGVTSSGVYIDPGATPGAFLAAAAERLPLLLGSQLLGVWSDVSGLLPFLGPHALAITLTLVCLGLALLALLVWPVLRDDALARFFALGTLLAAVPACSTFPADRLLSFVALGGAGLIARCLERAFEAPGPLGLRIAGVWLFTVHVVLSPPLLFLRARSMETVERLVRRTDLGIPRDPSVRDLTVIVATTPGDAFMGYEQITRASRREPRPLALRWLATGLTPVTIERLDPRTLLVTPEGGYLQFDMDRMLRGPRQRFHVGERVALSGVHYDVVSVTADGRPLAVRVQFDFPLDDPTYVWLRWHRDGLVPYRPPAVGERETLPAIDMMDLLALANRTE